MIQAVRWERILVDPELLRLSVIALAALSVGGIAYVFVMPFLSGERKTGKRIASVARRNSGATQRDAMQDGVSMRKKKIQDTLKELEAKQKSRKKLTLQERLSQAGLNVPVKSFYIASAVCGLAVGGVTFVTGSALHVAGLAALAASLGFPRWLLGFLARRRQNQFLIEFSNAVDIIVRGVKSGLPLHDCLRIIAEETVDPVKSEFVDVVEQIAVGVPLPKVFARLNDRMPLQEVNFFCIVIAIQQQTGGNLAEALDNLAQVLRGRQRLHGKVLAFSAEAKASAAIIGSLPLAVLGALAVMTPDYVMLLWTEELGKVMMMMSGAWMTIGVLVMKKMINFDY